jgi:acyl-coenzyme A synthetase/AMP-(fatty) acid ligase
LCFLGRTDHQVKIYGQRVELPEVEHALRQSDQVAEVVVEARDILGTGKQLVAYVIPSEGGDK